MAKTLQAGFFRGFQVTLLVRPHLLSERYLDRLQLLESSKFGRVRRHFKRNRLQRPSGMEKSLWSSDLQDQKPLYMSRHRPRPPNCQSVYPARSHSRHHSCHHLQQPAKQAKPCAWLQVHPKGRLLPVLTKSQHRVETIRFDRERLSLRNLHHPNVKHNGNFSRNAWQR